jgi:hypothetical protein
MGEHDPFFYSSKPRTSHSHERVHRHETSTVYPYRIWTVKHCAVALEQPVTVVHLLFPFPA